LPVVAAAPAQVTCLPLVPMAAVRAPVGIVAAERVRIEVPAERTALEVATSLVVVGRIGTLSAEAQGAMTDRGLAQAAAAAPPAWDLEAEGVVAEVVVGGGDRDEELQFVGWGS